MVSSNDVQRLFLQTMISRRVVSDKLAHVLWEKCIEAVKAADDQLEITYDPNKLDQYINDMNHRLEPLDLKLTLTIDEVVGEKLWAMINMKGDELVQMATDYSPVEIAYFKALIEQIILASSETYSISSMTALREVNNLTTSMSKTQAEVVLASFVAQGWLLKSSRGRFSLSSRTLLELQQYLKDNYEDDIHECTLCFELVTKGVKCYVAACSGRLHNHCYKRFARDGKTCPTCRADWSQSQNLITIGEGALKDGQDSVRTTGRDEDSETDDSEEDELESEPKPKKGKAITVKGKKTHQEVDEDDMEDELESEPKPKKGKAITVKGKKTHQELDEDDTEDELESEPKPKKGKAIAAKGKKTHQEVDEDDTEDELESEPKPKKGKAITVKGKKTHQEVDEDDTEDDRQMDMNDDESPPPPPGRARRRRR